MTHRIQLDWRTQIALTVLYTICLASQVNAQRKEPATAAPTLLVAEPFAINAGKPMKVKMRGLKLDGVTEIRIHEPKCTAKLLGKSSKVGVDQKLLNLIGDMQLEAELTVPADTGAGEVVVTAVAPGGESRPLRLLINGPEPRVLEKEPNNGFRAAQPLTLPAIVDAAIQSPQDVDVYRLPGQAGQRLSITLLAGRYGSPLDPLVTVFDEKGRTLASSDEAERGANAKLELDLRQSGTIFVVVIDANDQGGPQFRYRLLANWAK